jgi:hypothetical protein
LFTAVVLLSGNFYETSWAVDSGATHHFCNDLVYFVPDSMVKVDILVRLGDDNTLHVYQSGIAILVLDSVTTIKIVALYVPEFRLSLLSVSQLAAQKYTTMFTSEFCLIHDEKKSLMLRIPPVNGLYRFTTASSNITYTTALITTRSGAGKDLPAARRQTSRIQPIAPAHEELPVTPPSNSVTASQSNSTIQPKITKPDCKEMGFPYLL